MSCASQTNVVIAPGPRGLPGTDGTNGTDGTDGTDGPTDAAGAIADGSTLKRGLELDLSAHAYLHENNSYHYFSDLGDLIVTGATGTNVMDLQISLIR